jgi:hypothetical protein
MEANWQYFCLSMPGQEVVELPESPYRGFAYMDGRIIEFGRECYQVLVFDSLMDLRLSVRAKDLSSPRCIPSAEMVRFEKSAKLLYFRSFRQSRSGMVPPLLEHASSISAFFQAFFQVK